jgi:hemolysin activation/secretion protein
MNFSLRSKQVHSLLLCILVGYSFSASEVAAQSAIDQSRADRVFEDRREFFEQFQKAEPQKITIPEKDGIEANIPLGAEKITLRLTAMQLEPAGVYDEAVMRKYYQAYVGEVVSLADIFKIAQKMTEQYHQDGYVLSRVIVPEQEIDQQNAVVKLKIIKGRIDRIFIAGLNENDVFLKAVIDDLQKQNLFNAKELEKKMLMLNQAGDRSIQAFLKPITDRPAEAGAIDLEFRLREQAPTHALSLDNFGSKYNGPWNASWVFTNGGFLRPFDRIGVNALVSLPLEEVGLLNLHYSLPLHQNGLSFETHFGYTRSQPGKELEDLEIKSESVYGGFGLSYPWLWTRQTKIKSDIIFDFNRSRSESLSSLLSKDDIRAIRMSSFYEGYTSEDSYQTAELKLSQGLDILGARETGSDDLSRAEGRSDFTKVELELTRNQALGQNLRARAEVMGQYAFDPLLSSEEFGVGGAHIGRGYDASEIIGDRGVAMSFEISHQNITQGTPVTTTPYAFYDVGKVWNIDKASTNDASIASTGVGMRVQNQDALGIDMFIAKPLTAVPDNRSYGAGRDLRAYVRLQTRF